MKMDGESQQCVNSLSAKRVRLEDAFFREE
jgi:hypothetical protein